MDQLPTKRYESEEARQYADLLSVGNDLQFVLAVIERLLTMLGVPEADRDHVAIRAHWTAALVAYIRCFGSGKRQGLDTGIFADIAGEPIGAHNYFKNTRDKHIAHSVNAFEEVLVGFVLGAEPTAGVEGVANLCLFRVSDGIADIRILQRLANHALTIAQSHAATAQQKLLAVAASVA